MQLITSSCQHPGYPYLTFLSSLFPSAIPPPHCLCPSLLLPANTLLGPQCTLPSLCHTSANLLAFSSPLLALFLPFHHPPRLVEDPHHLSTPVCGPPQHLVSWGCPRYIFLSFSFIYWLFSMLSCVFLHCFLFSVIAWARLCPANLFPVNQQPPLPGQHITYCPGYVFSCTGIWHTDVPFLQPVNQCSHHATHTIYSLNELSRSQWHQLAQCQYVVDASVLHLLIFPCSAGIAAIVSHGWASTPNSICNSQPGMSQCCFPPAHSSANMSCRPSSVQGSLLTVAKGVCTCSSAPKEQDTSPFTRCTPSVILTYDVTDSTVLTAQGWTIGPQQPNLVSNSHIIVAPASH